MSYSLQSRDLIADSIETVMGAQWYDANVALPGMSFMILEASLASFIFVEYPEPDPRLTLPLVGTSTEAPPLPLTPHPTLPLNPATPSNHTLILTISPSPHPPPPPGCDKNMPGCLIAMGRLNRPSLMVYGGTIRAGCSAKHDKLDIVSAFQVP